VTEARRPRQLNVVSCQFCWAASNASMTTFNPVGLQFSTGSGGVGVAPALGFAIPAALLQSISEVRWTFITPALFSSLYRNSMLVFGTSAGLRFMDANVGTAKVAKFVMGSEPMAPTVLRCSPASGLHRKTSPSPGSCARFSD
jgi:hypothetical protein